MDEFIVVGEVSKPQGLSGEVKIKSLTGDILRFKKLRAAYIDTALCQILAVRIDKGFVYIKFAGVDCREKAEKIVGKLVKIDRIHALATGEDEFFIADLLGCGFVTDDGRFSGTVVNVWQHGAADVIEVDLIGGGKLMFPFLKSLNLDIDIIGKKISGSAEELEKVAVINID